jgi:hypothetical protein
MVFPAGEEQATRQNSSLRVIASKRLRAGLWAIFGWVFGIAAIATVILMLGLLVAGLFYLYRAFTGH